MKIVRHARSASDTAIAIGSFDGVHVGHRAMLARVCEAARQRGLTPAALTFEPLPREFFSPATAPARLSSLSEKIAEIANTGIESIFAQRFDASFAALTPGEFAARLRDVHRARWVMTGQDFRYGAGRKGDVASLAAAGRSLGFEVEVLPAVTVDGDRA